MYRCKLLIFGVLCPPKEVSVPRHKPPTRDIELDLGRYELRRAGLRVKLEKKPMELLIFLVARRQQLVSREDIVARIWHSDLFGDSERNINNLVRKIRSALGDNSAKPRFIETVVGKGYRFIGPIRVIDARFRSELPAEGAPRSSLLERELAADERTSLAVLPLRLLEKATDDAGVCLGFADGLVTRLGNLRQIDVLPTSAVLNLPADVAVRDIAQRLNVRFLLHGIIGTTKGQERLSVELWDSHLHRSCFSRSFDLRLDRLSAMEDDVAKSVADALHRPLRSVAEPATPRYSRDPLAYSEFMRGYQLSSSGDPALLEQAAQHLANAVTRDPHFFLAHAILAYVCAARHFEFDPSRSWLEKAEFHCLKALEGNPNLPEGHVANAFLLWGPSKNFQHLEAIAELKRAIRLQRNLPHAYNRLGTILAHVGLLEHAREAYERGIPFNPRKQVSHSIVHVYVWSGEYDLAQEEVARWRAENPSSKYAIYFGLQAALLIQDWKETRALLKDGIRLMAEEPLLISLLGLFHARAGKKKQAMECLTRACATPKSFGHAHHTYYQIACILAVLEQPRAAFEWLERSVDTGFACWPFFLRDPYLQNLRRLPEMDALVAALQAKYPDHLGLLYHV